MAAWNVTNPKWPQLERLNAGSQFTENTPVTQEILNAIVQALIYLYYKKEEGKK